MWILRNYKEIASTAAAGTVLIAGWMQAEALIVVNAALFAALLWLVCDPWRLLSWRFCSRERLALAAAAALIIAGVEIPGLRLSARIVLIVVSIVLCLVWYRNRALWRQDMAFLQSEEVNQALSHLTNAGQWAAGEAWTNYGRAEVGAFTRQGLNQIMTEEELDQLCRPAFQIGFADGELASKRELEKLRRQLAALERGALDYRSRIATLQETLSEREDTAAKVTELEEVLTRFRAKVQAQRDEIAELRERLELFEEQQEPAPENTADRNAQMLELHEQGVSYAELAKRFNLTPSGAKTAIRRAKADQEEAA